MARQPGAWRLSGKRLKVAKSGPLATVAPLSPARFLLALVIVCAPVVILEETDRRAAWALAFLLILSFATYHAAGLQTFAAFVAKELGQ